MSAETAPRRPGSWSICMGGLHEGMGTMMRTLSGSFPEKKEGVSQPTPCSWAVLDFSSRVLGNPHGVHGVPPRVPASAPGIWEVVGKRPRLLFFRGTVAQMPQWDQVLVTQAATRSAAYDLLAFPPSAISLLLLHSFLFFK